VAEVSTFKVHTLVISGHTFQGPTHCLCPTTECLIRWEKEFHTREIVADKRHLVSSQWLAISYIGGEGDGPFSKICE